MSARRQRPYEFSTPAQWSTCLFSGATRDSAIGQAGLHPHIPVSPAARRIASNGAQAAAMSPAGEILWRDESGHLLRAMPDDESAEALMASWAIAQARRMVVLHDSIWVPGAAASTLECFDLHGLQRLQVLTVPDADIVDLAADGSSNLLVLVRRHDTYEIVQFTCERELVTLAALEPGLTPAQVTSLPSHIFILDSQGTRLSAFKRGAAKPDWTRQLAAFRPCFRAIVIGSDARRRVFAAGVDGSDFGSVPHALVLAADGELMDCVQLPAVPTGVAGGRNVLVVSDASGVAIHSPSAVAGNSAAVEAQLITPLLRAPDSASELKWQRADLWATLPEGTTIELRYGWTADQALATRARAMQSDTRFTEAQRLAWLRESLDQWSAPVVFAGNNQRAIATAEAAPLSFPLHDARTPELWLHVTLLATPRSALPSLTRMVVSYAASELLEQLPAVHRRTAIQPGDFLGALVGTLEATTQDLDRRISSLGSLVHPDTAPERWLDLLAESLGLPWDDALSVTQKRALIRNADVLATQRGTRTGLTTLLASLFPGTPGPYRITDVDVDFGFASLGGEGCKGSVLPAVLAGLPTSATVLSRKTILGRACLPARGAAMPSATARLSGHLRIDITAPTAEQRAARPWLARLVESIVPAHLHIDLRWRTSTHDVDSDGEPLLAPPPTPHLGEGAVLGVARLPFRPDSSLSP